MTDQQVLQALDLYEQMLKARGAEPIEVPHNRCPSSPEEALNHILSMIAPMRQFLAYRGEGLMRLFGAIPFVRWFVTRRKREKVMRWLGFQQGVFWSPSISVFPLDKLKDHNR